MLVQKSQLNILLLNQRDTKTHINTMRLAFYRHKLTTNQPGQSWPSTAVKIPMLRHRSEQQLHLKRGRGTGSQSDC